MYSKLQGSYLLLFTVLLVNSCSIGDLRHNIEKSHLAFFKQVRVDSIGRFIYEELDQECRSKDSLLIFEFYYTISWSQNALISSGTPGYNGVADSIVNISMLNEFNGDTIIVSNCISKINVPDFTLIRKSKKNIFAHNDCSLGSNDMDSVSKFIKNYNTFDKKSNFMYYCLEEPIRLQLSLSCCKRDSIKNNFFLLTELKSGKKVYSNSIALI